MEDINKIREDFNKEIDGVEVTPEMQQQIDEINEIINSDMIDPTTALNILINVAQVSFDQEHLSDLDRHLITKAFICIQDKIDKGENFEILIDSGEEEFSEENSDN